VFIEQQVLEQKSERCWAGVAGFQNSNRNLRLVPAKCAFRTTSIRTKVSAARLAWKVSKQQQKLKIVVPAKCDNVFYL
jgi:hypothetical protein